jgi:hypothetical protein
MLFGDSFSTSWNLPNFSKGKENIFDEIVKEAGEEPSKNIENYVSTLKARIQIIHQNAKEAQRRLVEKLLKEHNEDPKNPIIVFNVGDFILLKHRHNEILTKQEAKLLGPYKVIEKLAHSAYKIQSLLDVKDIAIVSEDRMVMFVSSSTTTEEMKKLLEYDAAEIPVEEILEHNRYWTKSSLKFKVHWKGFDNESDYTWEPHKNLVGNVKYKKYLEEHKEELPAWVFNEELDDEDAA